MNNSKSSNNLNSSKKVTNNNQNQEVNSTNSSKLVKKNNNKSPTNDLSLSRNCSKDRSKESNLNNLSQNLNQTNNQSKLQVGSLNQDQSKIQKEDKEKEIEVKIDNKSLKNKLKSQNVQLSKFKTQYELEAKKNLIDSPQTEARKLKVSLKFIQLCKNSEWDQVDNLFKIDEVHSQSDQKDEKKEDEKMRLDDVNLNVVDKSTKWSPIMFAIKDNKMNILEKLLAAGFNPNIQAEDKTTAVYLACFQSREDMLRILLTFKANPLIPAGTKKQYSIHLLIRKWKPSLFGCLQLILKSAPKKSRLVKDIDGNIPLFIAVETSNYKVCRELLNYMAKEQFSAQKPLNGDTVIHLVTRKKDMEMMKFLIEFEPDLNIKNKFGQTPVHIAAEIGDETWIKFFTHHNADLELEDLDDKTALHIAAEKQNWKLCDYMIDTHKASLKSRNKNGETLVHIAAKSSNPENSLALIRKGAPIRMSNKDGSRPIHIACQSGNIELVKNLLQKGEDVHIKNNSGYTPLHVAMEAEQGGVVEILLANRADVNVRSEKTGETPLHLASRKPLGRYCAYLLIKSGADLNAVNKNQETALHLSAAAGHLDVFSLLLDNNADYNKRDQNGDNILQVAVKNCHFKIAQRLLKEVKKLESDEAVTKLINQQNNLGETSVHYLCLIQPDAYHYENEDKDLVNLLLNSGGDVSVETFERKATPVHYCGKTGNSKILEEIFFHLQPLDVQSICNKPSKNGWTPLLYACNYGKANILNILLKHNAKVDVFDEKGRAGLHLAAETGNQEIIDILLKNNAFVNVRNKNGITPLHLAAKNGFSDMVEQLITKYDAQVDPMSLNKQTPLHLGAEYGQLKVCETLLNLKADIKAVDNQNQTALHLAAESNHPEVFKLFLKTNPELLSVPNKNGYTCEHIAATKGSVSVLQELMKFDKKVITGAKISKTESTPLHLAAEKGHVKVVKILIAAGAKATEEDNEGMTALHLAAKYGHIEVLRALKDSIDFKMHSRRNGLTALHVAASSGQTDCVSELLIHVPGGIQNEKSIKEPNGECGITPLHLAAQYGHESVARLLMNSTGVQVDAATKIQGTIPIHLAAEGGHMIVTGLLISRSADALYRTDKLGRTCLHFASAHGYSDMILMLLSQGAEVNAIDKKGWTPLHYAARNGFLDVVRLLVENGGDTNATNKDNKNPLCLATASGHLEIISYLLTIEHDSNTMMDDKNFLMDLMFCSKNHNNLPIQEFILKSGEPIDVAVKLARNFEQLAIRNKDKARDILAAKKCCDNLGIELLNIISTTYNAGDLLRAVDYKDTEFLDVLIELERKEVVSQHAVQKYLTKIWIGNLKWSSTKFIFFFFALLFCPLVWIIISTPFGYRLHKIPIIKFMSYLTAHIYFIILLTYALVFPSNPIPTYKCCFPLWNEWLILFWLIGLLISEIINPRDRAGLGGIKTGILCVGFAGILVHIVAFGMNFFIDDNQKIFEDYWYIRRADILYIRNQLLALAMLFSFVEFLNFLTVHPLFGPWGVIIVELIQDLLKFLAILAIFLAGFTLHICAIYQPVYRNYVNNSIPTFGQAFIFPTRTGEMLFFALFGLVEPDDMPAKHLSPKFSRFIMKIVFGIYMMITIVVLINLLIAMMSNTYQRIESQSDTEWKFGRAKLIQNMNRTLYTPPPINLIIGLPILAFSKIKKTCFDPKKKLKTVGGVFAEIASRRHSLINDEKVFPRRDSKTSRISVFTQKTMFLEDGLKVGKRISKAINWPNVIRKYHQILGLVLNEKEQEEEEE